MWAAGSGEEEKIKAERITRHLVSDFFAEGDVGEPTVLLVPHSPDHCTQHDAKAPKPPELGPSMAVAWRRGMWTRELWSPSAWGPPHQVEHGWLLRSTHGSSPAPGTALPTDHFIARGCQAWGEIHHVHTADTCFFWQTSISGSLERRDALPRQC